MNPAIILGAAQMGKGLVQDIRANQARKNNARPDYEIADEYFKNTGMYEVLAQGGLPQSELDRLHQNAMRGLSASLSAGLQMGADASTVGDYYQAYLDNQTDVGVRNSLQRFQNINSLANSRNALAEQKFVEFGYDKDAPFKDTAQAIAQQKAEGQANIFGGANAIGAGYMKDQQAKLYQQQIDAQNRALGTAATPVIDRGNVVGGAAGTTGVGANPAGTTYGDGFGNRYNYYGQITKPATAPVSTPAAPQYSEDYYFNTLMQNGGLLNPLFKKR